MKTKYFSILSLLTFLTGCHESFSIPQKNETSIVPVTCIQCRIFLSQTSVDGGFGGAAGADLICANDPNKPSTGIYKALLMDNTRNQTTNWVLKANQVYYRGDGTTLLGTTNPSAIFSLASGQHINNCFSDDFEYFWTGIEVDSEFVWSMTNNCSHWTSSSSGVLGHLADTISTDYVAISSNDDTCNTNFYRILCVEQ